MKRLLTCALALLLPVAASATTLNPVQLLNPTGSSSGQAIVSTGASSAPGWANVSATSLAAQAANTVVANVTGSSASPTAFAMPSCSGINSAIQYTSGTGFNCLPVVGRTDSALSQFASTTSAQLASVLSDETGTGVAVFSASPALTGTPTAPTAAVSTNTTQIATTAFVNGQFGTPPAIGATTPNSAAFTSISATGAITPSQTAGIVGTTTNNDANAGSVGETITATASGVAQTSATLTNVTSISLTAGQWDVTCSWNSTSPTSLTTLNFGLTTTSGAQAPIGQRVLLGGINTTAGVEMPCPSFPLKLASTTTVYLTSAPTFTGSMTVGGTIWAVRRR